MAESIIEHDLRDPLNGRSASAFEAELERRLKGRVRAAYIFGSFGSSSFGPESDIDLILVAETSEPFPRRGFQFSDLRDLTPAIELLVYTPEEFERLIADPSPGFWRSIATSLRRIV